MLLLPFKCNCTLLIPVLSPAVLGGIELDHCHELNIIARIYSFNISRCSAILFSSSAVMVCMKLCLLSWVHVGAESLMKLN
jgi:hypothetical protein